MEDTLRVSFVYRKKDGSVLILVLMEDTLRVLRIMHSQQILKVLILVLMEDTLREYLKHFQTLTSQTVLILVLMEDTLRDKRKKRK